MTGWRTIRAHSSTKATARGRWLFIFLGTAVFPIPTMEAFLEWGLEGGVDEAAAQHIRAVIEDAGLAWGGRPLGHIEVHPDPSVR